MFTQKMLMTTLLAASVAPAPQPVKRSKDITVETILELAPVMPEHLKKQIEEFFRLHSKIVSIVSGESYYHTLPGTHHAPLSMNFDRRSRRDRKFFSTAKKSLSDVKSNIIKENYHALLNNLVIEVAGGHWLIKTSSLFNRRANILHEMGLDHGSSKLPPAKLKEFVRTKGGRTFQTISRMVYWLRAKHAQEELHLDRICLPLKYLMHIPGRPTVIDDTNYVVVAEKLSGVVPILETNLLGDKEVVAQLTHIIIRASLYDIHNNNVLAKDGKACLIDFEQPNACKPSEFGCENPTAKGISGLKKLIKQYAQKTKQDLSSLESLVTDIVNSYSR